MYRCFSCYAARGEIRVSSLGRGPTLGRGASSGGQCGQLEGANRKTKSVAEFSFRATKLSPIIIVGMGMFLDFGSIYLNFGSPN